MNSKNQPASQTTQQAFHAMLARHALESEPRPAFDLCNHSVYCTNPEASDGQKSWSVIFQPTDLMQSWQEFDGKHWNNFPA